MTRGPDELGHAWVGVVGNCVGRAEIKVGDCFGCSPGAICKVDIEVERGSGRSSSSSGSGSGLLLRPLALGANPRTGSDWCIGRIWCVWRLWRLWSFGSLGHLWDLGLDGGRGLGRLGPGAVRDDHGWRDGLGDDVGVGVLEGQDDDALLLPPVLRVAADLDEGAPVRGPVRGEAEQGLVLVLAKGDHAPLLGAPGRVGDAPGGAAVHLLAARLLGPAGLLGHAVEAGLAADV